MISLWLHLEIISERIEREFGIEIIATTPSVNYEINLTDEEIGFIALHIDRLVKNSISFEK